MAKCVTTLGQVDICSDLQVRLAFGQMYPTGQKHLVAKCDTTLGQLVRSSGQVGIWSDVPPTRDILWPSVVLCSAV